MTPSNDGITGNGPDVLTTRLALRTWRWDPGRGVLLSVNAGRQVRNNPWLLSNAISSPEGEWLTDRLMIAQCSHD